MAPRKSCAPTWPRLAAGVTLLATLSTACATRQSPPPRSGGATSPAGPAGTAGAAGSEFPPEAVAADLEALYRTLQRAHYDLYARTSREAYDRQFAAVLRSIDRPMRRDEAATTLGRFVAFGHVAHARIDAIYDAFDRFEAAGGRRFPLSIRIVGGRAYLAENGSDRADLHRGEELVALDGQPMSAWLERTGRNVSADTPYMAHALLERDFQALLWLEVGPAERFVVTLRDASGRLVDRTVTARTAAEIRAATQAHPPTLRLPRAERSAHLLDGRTAYLRPGPFYGCDPDAGSAYDVTPFRRFIDASFRGFLEAGADRLLIDLRDNPGGDSSFSDLMVSWFATRPFRFASDFRIRVSEEAIASNDARLAAGAGEGEAASRRFAAAYARARPGDVVSFELPIAAPHPEPRFHGRVYVLVNRRSYSNAVAVAALVQDHGFGTVLGEETSDLATTLGAMETFTLPRTGLVVGFPKALIVRPSGDLTPRGVVPDVVIETPIAEGADDPVLARALRIVEDGP